MKRKISTRRNRGMKRKIDFSGIALNALTAACLIFIAYFAGGTMVLQSM